jgi:hypothetical protein
LTSRQPSKEFDPRLANPLKTGENKHSDKRTYQNNLFREQNRRKTTEKQLFSPKDLACVTQPTIFALANQEQRF